MEEAKSARTIIRCSFTLILRTLNTSLAVQPIVVQDVRMNYQLLEQKSIELDVLNKIIFDSLVKQSVENGVNIEQIDDVDDVIAQESDAVNSYPPTSENYEKAITGLRNRFGKEELLMEVYVRELLELVLANATKSNEKAPLSRTFDKLESHLRALESLGVTSNECAVILYPLVESSLPEELLRIWQRHDSTSVTEEDTKGRLTKLMDFLQAEVQNEEQIALAMDGFGISQDKYKAKEENKCFKKKGKLDFESNIPTATGLATLRDSKATSVSCLFCSGDHESYQCEQARTLAYEERQRIVKEKNACFNCLRRGHSYKRCKFNLKCAWCGRRHVLIMCRDMQRKLTTDERTVCDPSDKSVQKISLTTVLKNPEVFLQTLRVKVRNGDRECIVRAVLDSCSHRSYVLHSVVKQLNYRPVGQLKIIHMLFGGVRTEPQHHDGYIIHVGDLSGTFECDFVALSRETIVEDIPSVNNGPWIEELKMKGILLSDVGSVNEPISILLGADVLGKLQTGEIFNLDCGPTVIKTRLGWTLIGKKGSDENVRLDSALVVTSMYVREAAVTDLWNLDVLGIMDPVQTRTRETRQQEVKNKFLQTITVDKGRYEVCLPWKENHPPLPNNKDLAFKRLECVTRKLNNLNIFEDYQNVLSEWCHKGIIEEVPETERNNYGHYLPHRPVIKNSSTTRIRPVFDASASKKGMLSLNQCLEVGPNLIELIPAMLLRFREKSVGVFADIKKAFLQIGVRPEDRDFLRFLWWDKKDSEQLKIYRHTRVVFGVSSSPFLLGATFECHLSQALKKEKCAEKGFFNEKLSKSFYVGNCITSVDSVDQGLLFKVIATKVMLEGSFDLRRWEYTGDDELNRETSVLGMVWNKDKDVLKLAGTAWEEPLPSCITKRLILSCSHKIFDPVGAACPVLLTPKLLLQNIWMKKLGWDEAVSQDIEKTFTNWYMELSELAELQIPRKIFDNEGSLTFHVFVDAIQLAYAAAIFVRSQTRDENVKVMLLSAKSRVSPDKKITIPRLELLAATTGARLMNSIKQSLELNQAEVYYWSDSTTVLSWIQRENQLATFVWNRESEIRQLMDLPSRGCTTKQLLESKWWEGPDWLRRPSAEWPTDQRLVDEDQVNEELKKSASVKSSNCDLVVAKIANMCLKEESVSWYLSYFSKKESRKQGELSLQEISEAECFLLRLVQHETFNNEKSEKIKSLNPFVDHNGLIRLKTLIANREDSNNFRYPIVLDATHLLTSRLIEHQHRLLNHAGVQIVLNNLRERFWILRGQRAVKSVIDKCVTCKRYKVKHLEAEPAALPENRVRDAKIFEVVGVDYAGPVYLKEGQKAWIALFTCAVYRAIHLELVTALSTASFLEALRRFIARRGRPTVIYSDNGTNFEGASNLLRKIKWKEIEEYSSIRGIEWKFNPPSAAWWGGWWERLVRVVKDLLRRTLKKACLSYEELNTTLCDCEAVINSRPITYLSDDSSQMAALTPAMFLQENEETGVLDLDQLERVEKKKKLQYRQKIRDEMRLRFRSEYLGQLSKKVEQPSDRVLQVGEVVLIGSDNVKRLEWPLAKVIKVIPGKDGKIRVVKLKTASGELVRPIQRVYPLEVFGPVLDRLVESVMEKKSDIFDKSQTENDQLDEIPIIDQLPVYTRSGRLVKAPKRF